MKRKDENRENIILGENEDQAVHSLFILFKKALIIKALRIFFLNNLNNLRTVARLGVDKFTSQAIPQSSL
jgi:hypothetical protein